MSLNVFEIIIDSERYYNNTKYLINVQNNNFNLPFNSGMPTFWHVGGLLKASYTGGVSNGDFSGTNWSFVQRDLNEISPGKSGLLVDTFQDIEFSSGSDSLNKSFFLNGIHTLPSNHGMTYDKSTKLEDAAAGAHGYSHVAEYDKININGVITNNRTDVNLLPELDLISHSASNLGADKVEVSGVRTGSFTDGDLTGWTLGAATVSDISNGVADYAHLSANTYVSTLILTSTITPLNDNSIYKVVFERASGTDTFEVEVVYNVDALYIGGVLQTGVNEAITSSGDTNTEFYFSTSKGSQVFLRLRATGALSSYKQYRLSNISLQEVLSADRVAGEDNFAYLPNNFPTQIPLARANPWGLNSLDPDRILNYGSYRTFNVFNSDLKGASNFRSCSVKGGAYGSSDRYIEIITDDSKLHDSVKQENFKHFSEDVYNSFVFDKLKSPNKKYEDVYGSEIWNTVMPPTVFSIANHNPLSKAQSAKITYTIPAEVGGIGAQAIDSSYPSFDNTTNTSKAQNVLTDSYILNTSVWNVSGQWSKNVGEISHSGIGSNIAYTNISIVKGKSYLIKMNISQTRDTEVKFGFQTEWTKITRPSANSRFIIDTNGSGTVSTTIQFRNHFTTLSNDVKINYISVHQTNKLNLEVDSVASGVINDNSSFESNSEDWTGDFTYSSSSDALKIDPTSSSEKEVQTNTLYLQPSTRYVISYKMTNFSGVSSLSVYDGSNWILIPSVSNQDSKFEFLFSGSSASALKIKATTNLSSASVFLRYVELKSLGADLAYIDGTSNNLVIKPSFNNNLNAKIYRLKLISGQEYRFALKEVDASNSNLSSVNDSEIDYTIRFSYIEDVADSEEKLKTIASISRSEGYADSDGSGKILSLRLVTPEQTSPTTAYTNVIMSISSTFPGKRSGDYLSDKDESLVIEYFNFRTNNLAHASKIPNGFGKYTSPNKFIVTNYNIGISTGVHESLLSFAMPNGETVLYNQEFTEQSSENITVDPLTSIEAPGVLDFNSYLDVVKLINDESFKRSIQVKYIDPINDCPKDFYGFYTGGSVTTNFINGSPSRNLHFFADNISGRESLRSEFRLNEVVFETHEHNYITKSSSVTDALEFYYDPSKSSREPLSIINWAQFDSPLKAGDFITVSWNVSQLSGAPLVIDLGADQKVRVITTGSSSETIKLKTDVNYINISIANELDSYSLGSESLTNPSFTSNSSWSLGTSWTYVAYFGSMAISTGLTEEPSDLVDRYNKLALTQASALTIGQEYEVTINVSANPGGILNGGVLPVLGNFTEASDLLQIDGVLSTDYTSAAGEYKYRGVAMSTNLSIVASSDFVGFINSVSAKAITLQPLTESTITLNEVNAVSLASNYEIKSERWGSAISNNQNLSSLAPNGKNIGAYKSALRVYSTVVNSEEPSVITNLNTPIQVISPEINFDKVLLGDNITFKVNIPFMNSGSEVQFKFNSILNTISSAGEHEIIFSDVNPNNLSKLLLFDIIPGNSSPLDVLIESVEISGEKITADKEPVRLDLLSDFGLNYNLSKKDFNSLDKISGDYSKTIDLPATSNNKKALNFSGEINTVISETQKEGIPCLIKSNGENMFEGLIFLNETNLDEHGQTFLNASIRSGNSTWAEILKSKRLRGLTSESYEISPETIVGVDFDDNETESKSIVEPLSGSSILDFSDREIVFPLIDNGRLDEDIDGNTYIGWDNVKAAYRISNVMFKIFEDIGYSLNSEFFKSGNEWSSDVTSNFSSYIQNLIGIAPSISYTDEEVAESELDLSFSAKDYKSQGVNIIYKGVEDSLAKCRLLFYGTSSVKPAMHSHLLNKSFGLPLSYYACDYAFIRFDKVNVDKNSYHSYGNIAEVSPYISQGFSHDGDAYSNSLLRKKVGTTRSPIKSYISVGVSGYYDTTFSVNVTVDGVPAKNKFTVGLLSEAVTGKSYYRSSSSFGAEFFDIQDDSYVEFEPRAGSYENAKINLSRIQYLKAGEKYNVVALYGVEKKFGAANKKDGRSFSIYDLDMNLKLCKDIAPMKGKNNILYTQQADPKASYKNVLPDVSCLDFITEVSKIFNLIWDVDESSKTVTAEPFNDFYRINGDLNINSADPIYQSTIWRDNELDGSSADTFGYVSPPPYGVFNPTWTSIYGSVFSDYNSVVDTNTIRLEPAANTGEVSEYYLSQVLPTVAGIEYKFTFLYETNSPLQLLVGSSVGSNSLGETFVSGELTQPLTENDYSRDRFSFTFKASSTETHITFKLPLGSARAQYEIDNPSASVVVNAYNYNHRYAFIPTPTSLYSKVNLSDFLVTSISKTYVDWTDKSVITSVKENSLIKSNLNYKMTQDSSDYEVNIEKSGSLSSLFGDKFLNTGFSKLNEDVNISLSIFAAAKMNYSSLINQGVDSLLLPRIWSKPESRFEPQLNEELPLPNNSHEHKLAVLDGVKDIGNGSLNYGLNSFWVYNVNENNDTGYFATQKAKAYSYLSASSYSLFDGDSPNLTFSSDFSKGLSKSLFDVYHKPLMDMLSLRDKVVVAQVSLTSAEVAELDFRNLIHINGNIYILNKIKDFNFSGEATEVELLLVTPTK